MTSAYPRQPPEVVIDLGAAAPFEPDEERGPGPDRRRSLVGAVLAVVLLCVSGAAPPGEGQLRHVGHLSMAPGGTFAVAGDDLVLVAEPADDRSTLSAYGSSDGRLRWRVPAEYLRPSGVVRTGDLVLTVESRGLSGAAFTVARSAAGGEVRWSRPGRVLASEDPSTGFAVSEVRSFTGPGRRVEGPVLGVDLSTGVSRWSTPVPRTAVVEPVPTGPPRVLVLRDSGEARLLDSASGATVASVRLPPADYAPDNPAVIGDRLVLRHRLEGERLVTAYALPELTMSWSRAVADRIATVRSCGRLVCLYDEESVRALDPVDGAPRWVEPAGQWRTVSRRQGTGRAVHVHLAGERVLVAVSDDDGLHLVGAVPVESGDCRADRSVLVCRAGSGRIGVWRLPGPSDTGRGTAQS